MGPKTTGFLQGLLATSKTKVQGYRWALAFQRMEKDFGGERLEAACARALDIGAQSPASVRSILSTGLDRQQAPDTPAHEAAFDHPNVRGSSYYH